jgi:hypothetical protein
MLPNLSKRLQIFIGILRSRSVTGERDKKLFGAVERQNLPCVAKIWLVSQLVTANFFPSITGDVITAFRFALDKLCEQSNIDLYKAIFGFDSL